MSWNHIVTVDAHSDLFSMYVDNSEDIQMVLSNESYDTIIFPDKGAATRYNVFHANKIIGNKVRDQKTGWITHYELQGTPKGKCLVLDDLCDGGMTFLKLAESISCDELHLHVTHGLFSKGVEELLKWYDKIYTTNSCWGNIIQSGHIEEGLAAEAKMCPRMRQMYEAFKSGSLIMRGIW
jgi:ribose-phosphate pyrophosphokinase